MSVAEFSGMTTRDLELILDKVPIEYPALVKEAFLNNWHGSAHRTEIVSNCASMNEKYCWVLSRNKMFIWDKQKTSQRATAPSELPLPTSGLPRSAKCVVVYDSLDLFPNRTPYPGVLIVSPEGVLRHWTTTRSQNYIEKTLDINSEVVLRVELTDEPTHDKSASFLLTTTSGTIYFLNGEGIDAAKTGSLMCNRVCGREGQGFRRRLSSIMFGSGPSKESTSMVTNAFQYQAEDLLVVAVSPEILTVYNMRTPGEVWSLKVKDFWLPKVEKFMVEECKKDFLVGVRCRLIDAAVFRGGLLVLIGSTYEESGRVHLILNWLGPEWTTQAPTKARFECTIRYIQEHRALFSKKDDSIYNSLNLCIPKETAEAASADRTDGVLIVNPYFALSAYFPFNLEKPNINEILYKVVSYPSKEQLIGYAICHQYVYLMMLETGVSTLRLLPRGFADGTDMYFQHVHVAVPSLATGNDEWPMLSELLSEMVASGLPKSKIFQKLHKSFELFAEKEMGKAAEELKDVQKLADQELTRTVSQFLYAIIDYSDAANKTDTELHAKRVLTSRFMLFLKHMDMLERVGPCPLQINRGGILTERCGHTMMGEVSERVCAAIAIWTWKSSKESNASLYEAVIEKVLHIPEVQDLGLKDRDALFGRCSLVHHIPVIASQQLDKKVLTKVKTHRLDMIHSVCELLFEIKEAIMKWRLMKVMTPKIGEWWTAETFTDCYRVVTERIFEELRDGLASDSERKRLETYLRNIYDFHLCENLAHPDNDKNLASFIAIGKDRDALELAERHRDFGTLVKYYLATDPVTRQNQFDRYKRFFAKYDFEMYLCDYLKRHGKHDILLMQTGKRVDMYLDNFKELRFNREIANKQFGKAALTLMSLAENETKSFEKFSNYLTRANFCAQAAKGGAINVDPVLDFFKRRYPEMKHRNRIPMAILAAGYGNDLDVMMSVEEMLEWNMANTPNDEASVAGFARAFHLLADLVEVHPESEELKEKIEKTWKALVEYDEWGRVRSKADVEKKTIFGKFCQWLVDEYPADKGDPFPYWLPAQRLLILPTTLDTILDESIADKAGNHTSWIKGHVKWVKEELTKKAQLPKTSFFMPDIEAAGSFGQAALEGLGPIFEARRKRLLATKKPNDAEDVEMSEA